MFPNLLPFLILTTLILLTVPARLTVIHFTQPPVFLNPESRVLSATTKPSTSSSLSLRAEGLSPKPLVFGFLPYWLINQADHLQYDQLTHLAYFGIEFDDQGQLMARIDDGSRELGLHRLNTSDTVSGIITQTTLAGAQPVLTVKILNNEGITAAISPENRDSVIQTILQTIQDHQFTGLNIDFEYIHTPPPEIKTNFTEFIKKLRQELNNYPLNPKPPTLTIDVYADAAAKQPDRLWQLADLAPYVDHFIIMGYDFHRPTSPQAGPIAPLRGAPGRWEDDLITSLREFTRLVPPQKLILGTAFYGYEWETLTDQSNSTTVGRGYLATYSRVQTLIDDCQTSSTLSSILYPKSCILSFDPEALSPYLIYEHQNELRQVWYEDSRSLSYKLQLINQANLAGLAIWALGYESPYTDLWQTISQNF